MYSFKNKIASWKSKIPFLLIKHCLMKLVKSPEAICSLFFKCHELLSVGFGQTCAAEIARRGFVAETFILSKRNTFSAVHSRQYVGRGQS